MSKNKELKSFNEAKRIRETLISNLEKCKTAGRFKAIMEQFRKDTLDGHFSIVNKNLNKPHRRSINSLDAQIQMLINEKREEFEPKLTQLHEQEVLKQKTELSLSSDESEHSNVVENFELVDKSEVSEDSAKGQHDLINKPSHEVTQIPTCCGPIIGSGLKKDPKKVTDSPIDSAENPVVTKQIMPRRVGELVRVKEQLDALLDKQAEFVGNYHAHKVRYPHDVQKLLEYENAIKAAGAVYDNVNYLYNAYIHGNIDLDHFKQAAELLLDDEVEDVQTLKSHRGYKEGLSHRFARG